MPDLATICAVPGQVQALLDSCDGATAAGLRDLAMLTLMARMGLRAGEVSALCLEDIGWRTGEITIRGKGNRRDLLPLPPDAGEATAAWLRHGRPATALDPAACARLSAPASSARSAVTFPPPSNTASASLTPWSCSPKASPWTPAAG